jgi:hypothetical protein
MGKKQKERESMETQKPTLSELTCAQLGTIKIQPILGSKTERSSYGKVTNAKETLQDTNQLSNQSDG